MTANSCFFLCLFGTGRILPWICRWDPISISKKKLCWKTFKLIKKHKSSFYLPLASFETVVWMSEYDRHWFCSPKWLMILTYLQKQRNVEWTFLVKTYFCCIQGSSNVNVARARYTLTKWTWLRKIAVRKVHTALVTSFKIETSTRSVCVVIHGQKGRSVCALQKSWGVHPCY